MSKIEVYKIFSINVNDGEFTSKSLVGETPDIFVFNEWNNAQGMLFEKGLGYFAFLNKRHAVEACTGKEGLYPYLCETTSFKKVFLERVISLVKNEKSFMQIDLICTALEAELAPYAKYGVWCKDVMPILAIR